MVWIQIFHTQLFHTMSFADYSGVLEFLTFVPIGALAGGCFGAAALAYAASQDAAAPRATA